MDNKIVYKEESYAVLGACFEVYKEKGCGFLRGGLSGMLGTRIVR